MLADRIKVYGCILLGLLLFFSLIIIPAGLSPATGNINRLHDIAIGLSVFWGFVIVVRLVLAVRTTILKKSEERAKPLRPFRRFFKPNVDRMEKKRDTEGLAEALFYKRDPAVRREAAEALGRIGEGGAWELAQAILDENGEVSQSALAALRERGDAGMKSITAMIALSYYLPERDENDREAHQNMRNLAFVTLAKLGASTVPVLITSLSESNPLQRKANAIALGYVLFSLQDSSLTAGAMPPLTAALQDEEEIVREAAATALGMASDEQALQPLIAALDDSSAAVRAQVRQALKPFGWEPSIEMLASEFDDLFTQYTLEAAHNQFTTGQTVNPEELTKHVVNKAGAVLAAKHGLTEQEVARAVEKRGLSKLNEMMGQREPSVQPEDQEEFDTLRQLCDAYAANDKVAIARLEPLARQIGEALNQHDGLAEMQRMFALLGGRRGSRTLEMHWNGIGEWRG